MTAVSDTSASGASPMAGAMWGGSTWLAPCLDDHPIMWNLRIQPNPNATPPPQEKKQTTTHKNGLIYIEGDILKVHFFH